MLGTAIYVYGILCHIIDPSFITTTDVSFSIDDQPSVGFSHAPDGEGSYTYHELLFSIESLTNAQHTLVIQNGRGNTSSLLLLDYLVYTK